MPLRNKGVYEPLGSILDRLSMPIAECGCWAWLGGLAPDGYPRVRWQEADGTRRVGKPYRIVCELAHGQIPSGHEVDHTCNQIWCVNPDHLEAVTPEENVRRREYPIKPFCDKGHPRVQTTEKRGRGYRYDCPTCRDAFMKERHATRTAGLTAAGFWKTDEYKADKRDRERASRAANRETYNARKLAEWHRRHAAQRLEMSETLLFPK